MDGGAWKGTVHGSQRVGHDWAISLSLRFISYATFDTLKHLLLMGNCNLDRTVSSRPTTQVSSRLHELPALSDYSVLLLQVKAAIGDM